MASGYLTEDVPYLAVAVELKILAFSEDTVMVDHRPVFDPAVASEEAAAAAAEQSASLLSMKPKNAI